MVAQEPPRRNTIRREERKVVHEEVLGGNDFGFGGIVEEIDLCKFCDKPFSQ